MLNTCPNCEYCPHCGRGGYQGYHNHWIGLHSGGYVSGSNTGLIGNQQDSQTLYDNLMKYQESLNRTAEI